MQVYGLSEDGQTITLRRFNGGVTCAGWAGQNEETKTLLVVDVETTGLDAQNDRLIEFAAAQLNYLPDGTIVEHVKTKSWLQDPDIPIPKVVTDLTGIADEDVAGKHIPVEATWMLAGADMIVSHNAAFDWKFVWRQWPDAVSRKLWACSLQQIDWRGLGFPAARQEILTRYHGFFYDAHRAEIDVEALVELLQMRPHATAPTYLGQLIDFSKKRRFHIRALGTPFAAKDQLKERGYRWDSERRHWWTTCMDDDLEAEQSWLDQLYNQFSCRGQPDITSIDLYEQWA